MKVSGPDDNEPKPKLHPSFKKVGPRHLTDEELVEAYLKAYRDANDSIYRDAAGARLGQLQRAMARKQKPF